MACRASADTLQELNMAAIDDTCHKYRTPSLTCANTSNGGSTQVTARHSLHGLAIALPYHYVCCPHARSAMQAPCTDANLPFTSKIIKRVCPTYYLSSRMLTTRPSISLHQVVVFGHVWYVSVVPHRMPANQFSSDSAWTCVFAIASGPPPA